MQCPGQDNRYWSGEAVFELPCPHCGNILEFFKDDSQRTCKQCGHKTLNPKIDFGCASYCPYAEQCMGSLPSDLRANQDHLFKERLALAVRQQLQGQDHSYRQVTTRAEFAEKLGREEGGNMAAIVAAALLSRSENAQALLTELATEDSLIKAVTKLLALETAGNDGESRSAAIFHDACLLADRQLGLRAAAPAAWQTAAGRLAATTMPTTNKA